MYYLFNKYNKFETVYICLSIFLLPPVTPWRNGSASDSRSEGCVFESRRGQTFSALGPSTRK